MKQNNQWVRCQMICLRRSNNEGTVQVTFRRKVR